MDFNKVLLGGRLTRDPELRYTPSGAAVVDMGMAVNRYYTDKSGQKQEDTCFVDVVLWQKQAELCQKYLHKGSPIFIEGRLTFDSWEGQDGKKRSKLKVVCERMQFIGGAKNDFQSQQDSVRQAPVAEPGPEQQASNNYTPPVGPAPDPQQQTEEDDRMKSHSDIPF